MFDAWYNRILKTGLKFELGMTDTDSFLFKVSDKEKFLKKFHRSMDYSNYPTQHENFSKKNKAALGYFKDEFSGTTKCVEFIGLRSKCYAMKLLDMKDEVLPDKKVCKGVGRSAIKNTLKFDHYKKCLEESINIRQKFYSIRSTKHCLKTILVNKLALSYIDTKRWIFDCGIHSVPFGSFFIQKYYNTCPKCNRKK